MTISFILVQPSTPENIGAAARAMKTMGFADLRLVDPGDHLGDRARWMAHSSEDILENSKVFTNLENAIKDIDFLIGTSSKKRSVKQDNYPIRGIPQLLNDKGSSIRSVGILFGTEDRGLSNEHIAHCDILSHIPLKQSQPSLNMAQSVMVYAYELSPLNQIKIRRKPQKVNEASYRSVKENIAEFLNRLNLHSRLSLKNRIMERLAALSEKDIHLIQSILTDLRKQDKSC
ncbi:MAG: tRNA/rRNA methyltransferase [Candidatus Marinimicrobia bacterium]|nr:tRNA/rRNA methyltransferase [Candidatus Neomarinimicrobiota bacterium]